MPKHFRTLTGWLCRAAIATLVGAAGQCAHADDAALESCFRGYLDELFQLRPYEATQLGDHRFDHLLEDLSAPARAAWREQTRRALEALPRQVDLAQLSPAKQVDYHIYRRHLENSLWMADHFRPFEEDPRLYNEYLNDSVFLVLAQSSLPRETNVSNAMARIRLLPQVVAAARRNLTHPPRPVLETAIRQTLGALAFYERDIYEVAGVKGAAAAALRSAIQPVLPVLRDYQEFLQKDLMARATGEWRIGREKFAAKLERTLDLGLGAEELLAEAEREFARVGSELYIIARQLWGVYYPGITLPPDDPDGRREATRLVMEKVAQEHGRPEDLVKDARATVAQIKQFIAQSDFLKLPEPDRCRIIEMPEFQRGNSVAYMNSPPPLDHQAAGFYAISPPPRDWDAGRVKSLLEEYNRHMLQILTIHEAYPGHYVQHEYANRHASLLRRVLASGVYVEGWAVYTEQTMLDQGYGAGKLALRLNQLKFYQRAVANAILDHRMHCGDMTDEQALDFLVRQAFQSEGEARLKIIRAKQSSVQLSTYFAGRTALYRLRQQIQREMGDQFSLGRFHEAVLAEGPVPVKYLPELVRRRLGLAGRDQAKPASRPPANLF